MAEVLFITPNMQRKAVDDSIGTALLATILTQQGIGCEIMQFSRFGNPKDFETFMANAVDTVVAHEGKIVSFYARCDTYHIILTMAEQIKKRKDVTIVFGGPQADISAVDTLQEFSHVDYVCCGEGENTVYPFFSSLLQGTPDLSVPGLTYRRDGKILQNPRPVLIEDLDTLPEVDYSLLGLKQPVDNTDPFPIDVGRGCPFSCTYCSTKTFWGRKYRLKSPQRIYTEIKRLNEMYGVTYFAFEHDMFTMNRRQVVETCQLLKTLDFPVSWKCSVRIDCVDKELIDIMKDAGLDSLFIGIETGSPRVQKLINKNLKLEKAVDMLGYIHSKGIGITASFIYGIPEETEEDLSQTLALIAQIAKLDGAQIATCLCTFLPGTELTYRYLDKLEPAAKTTEVSDAPAFTECAQLISTHPKVFLYLWEYNTPLRTKLEHFTTFIRVWQELQPVYQYYSEQYPQERLLDMYLEWVEANHEVLSQTSATRRNEQIRRVIAEEKFGQKFMGEYKDIIRDYYRMRTLLLSDRIKEDSRVMDAYCFSPIKLRQGMRLQDCRKNLSMVTYTRTADGKIQMRVQSKA